MRRITLFALIGAALPGPAVAQSDKTGRGGGGFAPSEAVRQAPLCGILPEGVERQSCACLAGEGTGAVWGSGPYTADSDICTAALHAGAVGAGGGTVTVIRIGGLEAYSGSAANGVTTEGWSSYGSSFVFDMN